MSEKDLESRVEEKAGFDPDEERLLAVSKSIKAIGNMTGTGISYVILIPGYGEKEDLRLASCCIAPPTNRDGKDLVLEIYGNIVCMLQGFVKSMRQGGMTENRIKEMMDTLLEQVYQEVVVSGQ